MAARRPTNKSSDMENTSQRPQADNGRFRLRVDRQTKSSYDTYEAAEAAGMIIKKAHPVVQIAVYDTAEGGHKLLELPE